MEKPAYVVRIDMSCQLVTNNGRNFELGGKNLLEVGQKSWFKL